jgi:hypothetical protein
MNHLARGVGLVHLFYMDAFHDNTVSAKGRPWGHEDHAYGKRKQKEFLHGFSLLWLLNG